MKSDASKSTREVRYIPAHEQRVAIQNGRPSKLSGYAAMFNADSQRMIDPRGKPFVERIAPGAFSNTIKSADVRALVNHDPNQVIGRTKANTLRLNEDGTGLRYECDINPDDPAAVSAAAKVERGDMDGCSFGFRTVRDSWAIENGVNVRTLLEVELIDVGPVTFPAYQDTSVQARSLLNQLEGRGLMEIDDPSIRWQCRYLISCMRNTFDQAQSLIEAIANNTTTLTPMDTQATDDCLDVLTDTAAKLRLCKASLQSVGAEDTAIEEIADEDPDAETAAADEPRSSLQEYEKMMRSTELGLS